MNKIEGFLNKSKSIEDESHKRNKNNNKLGKLSAREKIDKLFDNDSFVELDKFAGKSKNDNIQNNVISGYGTVDGRLVFAYSSDYTVESGAIDKLHSRKIDKVQNMALEMGAPIVSFIDSAGGKIEEGIELLESYSKILSNSSIISGVVPQISVVTGLAIGATSMIPALSDFTIMVDSLSFLGLNGASKVKGKDSDEVTLENISGAKINSEIIGANDFIVETEEKAIEKAKELLSFLPSNNLDRCTYKKGNDDINRTIDSFNNYGDTIDEDIDIKEVILQISDDHNILEIKEDFAKNIITAFIRLDGKTVGVVANQPVNLGGHLDISSVKKASKFISLCDSFNIPILTLVDTPGFVTDINQEREGLALYAAKMVYELSKATVPKVSLIVGKAYGNAYISMGSKGTGTDLIFAWPRASISIIDTKAAAIILNSEEIASSDNPKESRKRIIEEYVKEEANPYTASLKGYVDDIILPSSSRARIISAFDMLETKRKSNPKRKHGNSPI